MSTIEINFDGLIGPTHNYAGLSFGNVASASNAGTCSRPRDAALQGLRKMKLLMELGLPQGFFPPPRRPAVDTLRQLGFRGNDREVLQAASDEDRQLFHAACSASAMWAANAATIIAAPDASDRRVHLITANLASMLHRSFEPPATYTMLRTIFADPRHFAVHPPLPPSQHFADEGAANHMRFAQHHGDHGINVFVHGSARGGRFPERQSVRAGQAIARMTGIHAVDCLQSRAAIEAGAFHNDVVAVANEHVLFAHSAAFEDRAGLFAAIAQHVPSFQPVEIDAISLDEAVGSYLFNSQLVTLPGRSMALILPAEARENDRVWQAVQRVLEQDNPIQQAIIADVRESMRNGGGPACLRLRVPLSTEAAKCLDPRFVLDDRRWEALSALVERAWPERIEPGDLIDPALWEAVGLAYDALDALLLAV